MKMVWTFLYIWELDNQSSLKYKKLRTRREWRGWVPGVSSYHNFPSIPTVLLQPCCHNPNFFLYSAIFWNHFDALYPSYDAIWAEYNYGPGDVTRLATSQVWLPQWDETGADITLHGGGGNLFNSFQKILTIHPWQGYLIGISSIEI